MQIQQISIELPSRGTIARKKSWKNPAHRKNRVDSISAAMKKKWKNPEWRIKMLKSRNTEKFKEIHRQKCLKILKNVDLDERAKLLTAGRMKNKDVQKRENDYCGVVVEN